MQPTESTALDLDELMHLALSEAAQNQTDKAIGHLKQALEIDPRHGKASYLLGALHAEIGLYDRAIDEMQKAVEYEPELHPASFQLGLLHLTAGRVEEAKTAWQKLEPLGEEHSLFLFQRGLLHLSNENREAALDDLTRGIELNAANPDLNIDMQRIAGNIRNQIDASPANDEDKASDSVQPKILSAYQNNDFDSSTQD